MNVENKFKEYVKGKNILIFGLGRLGGGVASVKWLTKKEAVLRITDLLTKKELSNSLEKLKNIKADYSLGKNRKEDIDWADIVVVNPGVSYKNPLIKYAREKEKIIENDCSLFFKFAESDIIAITGTRGKTTTSIWTHHFISNYYRISSNISRIENSRKIRDDLRNIRSVIFGGNQPDKALLKIISKAKKDSCVVLELSSFQLEFYPRINANLECKFTRTKAPKIALITNLYTDHLNRYDNLREYAKIKTNVFQNQTKNDILILNYDDLWTEFFIKLKSKSKIYFFSLKQLPKNNNGIFVKDNYAYFKENNNTKKLFLIKKFKEKFGEHNLRNLLASFLTSYLYIATKTNSKLNHYSIFGKLKIAIDSLPQIPFRQEIIYQNKSLKIVNDSAGTSPDATIQALRRFAHNISTQTTIRELMQKNIKIRVNPRQISVNPRLILITGGTDKNLDFKNLAKEIKSCLTPEQIIFLNGSATKKLLSELKKIKFNYLQENIFENLRECVKKSFKNWKLEIKNYSQSIVLFSPGASSFEKFLNEFDRGKKFNSEIKKLLKN